ncbi:MAG: 2-iminobutanoate/2-iminopropanoate deaminase [Myxococcota bacterium]|jgi:2-iminobutanoate/2-iminopropanoate deaminase
MKTIHTDNAPAAIGPYSQAVVGGGFCFCSGQIPMDPMTGELVGSDVTAQTHQVLKNLRAVLNAAGTDFDRVTKCVVFLQDMDDFDAMNAVYAQHMGDARPARAAVQVSKLPRGVRVEIDAVALV